MLRNEVKSEKMKAAKLLQYKISTAPRLEDFEAQAARMEVLNSVNIDRVIYKMNHT